MKGKEIKNMPESVRKRLYNISKQNGRRFDAVALLYFQERFLYRLYKSKHRKKLILKGALLLLVSDITRFRPTRDIDFLGTMMGNEPENLNKIISEIASIQVDDGLVYDHKSVQSAVIKEGADYEGVRVKLDVTLGSIKRKIQLDIAFGDTLVNGPVEMEFPVLLDSPPPRVLCYSFESVIAEKIESIVKFNFYTSRVKDFYDIIFLSTHKDYDYSTLHQAIVSTFKNRGTDMQGIDVIFSEDFKNDKEKQTLWKTFVNKNNIDISDNFSEIIEKMEVFFNPVFDGSKSLKFKWIIDENRWVIWNNGLEKV